MVTHDLQARIDRTMEYYRQIAALWQAPVQFSEAIHGVDPRLFHQLPREWIDTQEDSHPQLGDLSSAVAYIRGDTFLLRLYCGHNERCPLLTRRVSP